MEIHEIQAKMHVPKAQYNEFGNYPYRSAEDIIAAAKPILNEAGLYLNLSDEMVNIGNANYVKSTATIFNGSEVLHSATGYAREAEQKKGMDDSQITGSCSSYARKYALNGLFGIDEGKDADSMDNRAHDSSKRRTGKKEDDDKPWYNDFDSHKDMMVDKIADGESTSEQILENLRKQYKVSRATADSILALGGK